MFWELEDNYIDITPPISPEIAVFPGDIGFSRQLTMQMEDGDSVTTSAMSSTLHLGAHADAENHYLQGGKGIEKKSLAPYFGKCQVVHVKLEPNQPITLKSFQLNKIEAPRVLFRTGSFPDPDHWNGDFNFFAAETIEALAHKGVQLIGIDTPSVDAAASKDLPAHHKICEFKMSILEGLVLTKTEERCYQLVALPLPIVQGDASPVRAILIQ